MSFRNELSKSVSTLHPSIDLFSTNTTVCGVENSRFTEVSLVSGPTVQPFEFRVQNSKCFLNLARSYVLTRFQIVNEDGSLITADDANEVFAPVNLFGCAQFKEVQMMVNGVVVSSTDNFAYRSFISALLSFDDSYKKTFLKLAGYSPQADPTSATDPEYVKLVKRCSKSKPMEMITPIWVDHATQPRCLLPFIDLRLIFYPNPDSFMIDRRKGVKKYRINVLNMTLILNEIHVHNETAIAFNNLLQSRGSITYTSLGTSLRSVFIPPNVRSFPSFKVFSNCIPRRIFLILLDPASYTGNYSNPFIFKHFDLENVRLEAGGEVIPFNEYSLDFEKNQIAKAYLSLMECLGVAGTGAANGITPEMFASHCTIFAFDTSGGIEGEQYSLQRLGETTIQMTFRKDTPATGIYALILGEMVTNLVIDKDRVPHVY